MKAVILAGGLGTRISEESHLKPKPMIEIGGRPILWHIMKIYSHYGINEFVICLGYKGYIIKEYFANYFLHMSDVTFDMAPQSHGGPPATCRALAGDPGRYRRKHPDRWAPEARRAITLRTRPFCFTYGDGVSDLDIQRLVGFHRQHGRLATLTAIQPPGRYGAIESHGDQVSVPGKARWRWRLDQRRLLRARARGFDYIEGDHTSWESAPLNALARDGQLQAFTHHGFWQAMDTLRDKNQLEELGHGKAALEGVDMKPVRWHYAGRRVLLTGHTGFKGSLAGTLAAPSGRGRHGVGAIAGDQTQSLGSARSKWPIIASTSATQRQSHGVSRGQPEIVFHLAAQPLVRRSYREPLDTWSTNVMGTANLLEACRLTPGINAIVVVTSDKCYENREWVWGYRETDTLGGHDPYSASKAAAELVSGQLPPTPSTTMRRRRHVPRRQRHWRRRLVGRPIDPRLSSGLASGQPLQIRSPLATRPWQHVLEPLSGYLLLGSRLLQERHALCRGVELRSGRLEATERSRDP